MTLPFDDLFLVPFCTGLCFALLLPALGCYLRLRDEWLAALTYAQVAAAGALGAMAVAAPLAAGGGVAALLAAVIKNLSSRHRASGAAYALLLLAGWGCSVLLVANLPTAERMGHALFDGQLYFTDGLHLAAAAGWGVVALILLRSLSRRLLLARLYPDFFQARGLAVWPAQLGFDLLAAASLALATMSLGVMGAFALVFIPAWSAFARAANWRRAVVQATLLGGATYCLAFALALRLDQPFGPVLALALIALGLVSLLGRRRCA